MRTYITNRRLKLYIYPILYAWIGLYLALFSTKSFFAQVEASYEMNLFSLESLWLFTSVLVVNLGIIFALFVTIVKENSNRLMKHFYIALFYTCFGINVIMITRLVYMLMR
jgi:hypothetical protein